MGFREVHYVSYRDFLVKPITQEQINDTIETAIRILKKKNLNLMRKILWDKRGKNMRKVVRFLGIIVVGVTICAGCGKIQADTGTDQPNSISIEESGQSSLSMEERYRAILLSNGEFVCTDLQNKGLSIEKIKEAVTDDDSVTAGVSKFAYADLDNDGANEIVLWIQINGISDYGFEILRYQEDTVYGYTLPYTALMNLKSDGTFIFSGGAADIGIGKMRYAEGGYIADKLYYSESGYDSNNELEVQYFANGEKCSEEEFNDIMRQQEEKQNMEWYDLTLESVRNALGE